MHLKAHWSSVVTGGGELRMGHVALVTPCLSFMISALVGKGMSPTVTDQPSDMCSVARCKYMLRRISTNKAFEREGVYKSGKVPTGENVSDYVGKAVPEDKVQRSRRYTMGLERQPPLEQLLKADGQNGKVPGVAHA